MFCEGGGGGRVGISAQATSTHKSILGKDVTHERSPMLSHLGSWTPVASDNPGDRAHKKQTLANSSGSRGSSAPSQAKNRDSVEAAVQNLVDPANKGRRAPVTLDANVGLCSEMPLGAKPLAGSTGQGLRPGDEGWTCGVGGVALAAGDALPTTTAGFAALFDSSGGGGGVFDRISGLMTIVMAATADAQQLLAQEHARNSENEIELQKMVTLHREQTATRREELRKAEEENSKLNAQLAKMEKETKDARLFYRRQMEFMQHYSAHDVDVQEGGLAAGRAQASHATKEVGTAGAHSSTAPCKLDTPQHDVAIPSKLDTPQHDVAIPGVLEVAVKAQAQGVSQTQDAGTTADPMQASTERRDDLHLKTILQVHGTAPPSAASGDARAVVAGAVPISKLAAAPPGGAVPISKLAAVAVGGAEPISKLAAVAAAVAVGGAELISNPAAGAVGGAEPISNPAAVAVGGAEPISIPAAVAVGGAEPISIPAAVAVGGAEPITNLAASAAEGAEPISNPAAVAVGGAEPISNPAAAAVGGAVPISNLAAAAAGGAGVTPNLDGVQVAASNLDGGAVAVPNLDGGAVAAPNLDGGAVAAPNLDGGAVTAPNLDGVQVAASNLGAGVDQATASTIVTGGDAGKFRPFDVDGTGGRLGATISSSGGIGGGLGAFNFGGLGSGAAASSFGGLGSGAAASSFGGLGSGAAASSFGGLGSGAAALSFGGLGSGAAALSFGGLGSGAAALSLGGLGSGVAALSFGGVSSFGGGGGGDAAILTGAGNSQAVAPRNRIRTKCPPPSDRHAHALARISPRPVHFFGRSRRTAHIAVDGSRRLQVDHACSRFCAQLTTCARLTAFDHRTSSGYEP